MIICLAWTRDSADGTGAACRHLSQQLRRLMTPRSAKSEERLAAFIGPSLPSLPKSEDALTFLASLIDQDPNSVKEKVKTALRISRMRYAGRLSDAASLRYRKLLSFVVWPEHQKLATDDEIAKLRGSPLAKALLCVPGHFFSTKCNRCVTYKSELELKFYRLLEQIHDVVAYREQPAGLSYQSPKEETEFLPDVVLVLSDRRFVVVEIIPAFRMALLSNLSKLEALKRQCLKTGLGVLVTDGYTTLEQLYRYDVKAAYVRDVMKLLGEKSTLRWDDYRPLKERHDARRNDFLSLVLQERLAWQLWPFRLSTRD